MNYCQSFCRTIQRLCNIWGGGLLPAEYQQVEWIQNTDQARIITNVGLTSTYYLNVKFILTSTTTGGLFGGYSTNFPIGSYYVSRGKIILKSDRTAVFPSMQTGVLYNLEAYYDSVSKSYKAFLNGVEMSYASGSGNTVNNDFTLFFSQWGYNAIGKIARVTIKDSYNGNITLDLVPCYRKSDSKPGMYNLATNTFLTRTNNTGADFSVGADV